jgi:hypothetical protein
VSAGLFGPLETTDFHLTGAAVDMLARFGPLAERAVLDALRRFARRADGACGSVAASDTSALASAPSMDMAPATEEVAAHVRTRRARCPVGPSARSPPPTVIRAIRRLALEPASPTR